MTSSENRFVDSRVSWDSLNLSTVTMDKYRTSPTKADDRMMASPPDLSNSPKSFQDVGDMSSCKMENNRSSELLDDQCRRYRTNYSRTQIARLEEEFRREKYLSRPRRCELASELGLKENTIKVWFQNRRMKEKRQITSLALPVFANADPNLYAFLMESANAYMNYTASTGMPPAVTQQQQPTPLVSHAAPTADTSPLFSHIPVPAPNSLYHQSSLYPTPPAAAAYHTRHGGGIPPATHTAGGFSPLNRGGYEAAHLRIAMEQLNAQLEQQSQLYAAAFHTAAVPTSMALFDRAGFPTMLPILRGGSLQPPPRSTSSPSSPPDTTGLQLAADQVKMKTAAVDCSANKMKLFRPFVLADDN